MKISENLPQFSDEIALLIVTGSEQGQFFLVKNGEAEALTEVHLKDEKLNANRHGSYEGFAGGRNGSAVVGRSVEWSQSDDVKRFLKKLEASLVEIFAENEISQIYLFSPSYISKEILARVPQDKASLLRGTFDGNYSDQHLFKLLGMIKEERSEKNVTPRSAEAQKIYDKFPEEK